jgi:hypothetical protein
VQLPLGTLREMLGRVEAGDMFGSAFALAAAGAADLPANILIPGAGRAGWGGEGGWQEEEGGGRGGTGPVGVIIKACAAPATPASCSPGTGPPPGPRPAPAPALPAGVAVFSRRSLPMAAWTNGLEIAAVKADVDRSCLILETGVNQRWRYGGWRTTQDSIEEAAGWEEAKNEVK